MQATLSTDNREFTLKTGPLYRQEISVGFDLSGADSIVIDEDATACDITFTPFDYDAHNADAGELKAEVKAKNGLLLFSLDAPRQVVLAEISKPDQDCRVLDYCRVDGATPAEIATLQSCNGFVLPGDFTDMRFAVRSHHLADSNDDQIESLNVNRLTRLELRSFPTGPRLGIAPQGKPDEAIFFVHEPGEQRDGFTTSQNTAAVLTQALQKALERWFSLEDDKRKQAETKGEAYTRPSQAVFSMIMASDAPCRLTIPNLRIAYYRVCSSFTAQEKQSREKQVLRLGADNPTNGQVIVRLPGGAVIQSAQIKLDESLSGPQPTGSAAGASATTAAQGLYLEENTWIACPIQPDTALSIEKISVPVLGLTDKAALAFELRRDESGKPHGQCLASGKMPIPEEKNAPCIFEMQTTILDAATYWLAIKCTLGSAVWQAGAHGAAPECQKHIDGAWQNMGLGLRPLYRLFSSDCATTAKSLSLLLSGASIAALPAENQGAAAPGTFYDLKDVLNDLLTGKTGMVDIPLCFHSTNPGVLSIYPPVIVYDVTSEG